ncbi:MAG: PorT family protein [Bacteroidales bacterium]|nr:PorT family protein [Bacteroidales bacterium]
MKKRFLVLLFTGLAVSASIRAQREQETHELTFGASLGVSTLKLSLENLKPNGEIALGYNYFFNDIAGISTGIGLTLHRWQSSIDQVSDRYLTGDGEESFEFRSSISNYTELQTAASLTVPLAFRWQYPLLSDSYLTYFAAGGKVSFPFYSQYRTSGSTFTTSAWYPAYNALLESPSSQGLGAFTGEKQVSDLLLKPVFSLFVDVGMKWDIADQFSVYAGLYADYGLNNINREAGKPFLVYNPDKPADFIFNSVLEAQYTQEGKTGRFIRRTNPVGAGIVIRIAFKLPE